MSSTSDSWSHWLQNQSLVRFNSGTVEQEQVAYSNTVVTPWVGPRLEVHKQCSSTVATLGQSLIYLIEIVNSGNRTATVYVTDQLSAETALLPNSVLRDGIPLPGSSPEQGLPPSEIAPGARLRFHFQVMIIRLPESLKLLNQALVRYEFVTSEGRAYRGEERSNTVEVSLVSPRLEIALQADRVQTFPGDIVTYNIIVRNPGFVTATDAQVTVVLPSGIQFIPGSVVVNDMFVPQMTPDSGILIGDVLPERSIQIQYRAQVIAVLDTEGITSQANLSYLSAGQRETVSSNAVTLEVIQPRISISKTVTPELATVEETVCYDITVANESRYAVDATMLDVLPKGVRFVEGSLGWNGVKRPGANPTQGFNLGTLTARSTMHIQFEAQLMGIDQVNPQQFEIVNQARLLYTFRLPDSRNVQRTVMSNDATIQLKVPVITVYVEVSPTLVEAGGEVVFHVRITNIGSWPARVQLTDILPPGARWVGRAQGELQFNIPEYSTPRNLHLGDLEPGKEKELSYVVQIISDGDITKQQGSLTANYSYEWRGQRRIGQSFSNEYTILVEETDE
ncbi:hypothetical protein MH215_06425 [Paenibacillus sp. ACRSA]|uniref:DUF11 domain-containing protein n=1 Tax=Paenibacillus sp. ACRSA TaxID=2918211 RepID=UPI001EF4BA81|nr:DUF11 domain-containing protein [Paenibacillus sp. ACRSA]MCG7376624.1 hypothetical protein [Paenibacillus sp. ACRSA]